MSVGLIYVATGKQQYIDEACVSASSLKEQMPNLHVTLFSDKTITANCFDECRIIESSGSGILDKALGMKQSPYDYTLFLDTDTYIYGRPRYKTLAEIAQEINQETDPRFFHPRWGLIPDSTIQALKKIVKETIKRKLNSIDYKKV